MIWRIKYSNSITEMLVTCDEYKAWKDAGGRTQASKIANKASQKAKRQNNQD